MPQNFHPSHVLAHQQINGAEVISIRGILDRLVVFAASPRPEFQPALSAAGDHPVCVAVVPPPIFARATREILLNPLLGTEKPFGPIVAHGFRWAAIGVEPNLERFNAQVAIQSTDASAASALADAMKQFASIMAAQSVAGSNNPAASVLTSVQLLSLLPEQKGDQLVLSLDGERAATFSKFAEATWIQSTAASKRNQSMNNLKQIALSILNYEDKHHELPDRAIRDKDGKPLLSWRVAMLPDLEEGNLYREFHLDEPWDSEHNRKLIERMPDAFRNPDTGHLHPGRTRYLAVVGEQCIFPPDRAIKMKEITDGTSKTIMVVEADPEHSVIWTKPDDLEVDLENPILGLAGGKSTFNMVTSDGAAHTIRASLEPGVLRAMFTRNGGETIDWSKVHPEGWGRK